MDLIQYTSGPMDEHHHNTLTHTVPPRTSFSLTSILAGLFLTAAFLTAVLPHSALAAENSTLERIHSLLGDGALLLRAPSGEELISIHPDRPLIPASILKIPTAQLAINVLGEDYRFETHFYTNDDDDLLIRGLGDPFLVSEEIALIATALKEQGLNRVHRVVMDDSAFVTNLDLPSEANARDPYAARNSALAANFNTVNLAWNAAGELISAEEQTPLTPLAQELGARLSPGEEERINLGSDPETNLQQAQQLFQIFLRREGIEVIDSAFYREPVSDEWTRLYQHSSSRSLRDNLEGMLLYSNNFIANQLFLTIAARREGYPVSAEVAREVLQKELATFYDDGEGFGSDSTSLLMLEGSGLDRAQRSTANAMMTILENFKTHFDLLPESDDVFRKSGTLTGVYNYAGFIRNEDGLYPFVILTSQAANHRDEILRLLVSASRSAR